MLTLTELIAMDDCQGESEGVIWGEGGKRGRKRERERGRERQRERKGRGGGKRKSRTVSYELSV